MSHRKWRETKQQLIWLHDLALLGCCLVSPLFLCDILFTGPVIFSRPLFCPTPIDGPRPRWASGAANATATVAARTKDSMSFWIGDVWLFVCMDFYFQHLWRLTMSGLNWRLNKLLGLSLSFIVFADQDVVRLDDEKISSKSPLLGIGDFCPALICLTWSILLTKTTGVWLKWSYCRIVKLFGSSRNLKF